MKSQNNQLISLISNSSMIFDDCDSFLLMRMRADKNYYGAGNWLQIIGLFAVFNLYGKINWVLEKDSWQDNGNGMTWDIIELAAFQLICKQTRAELELGIENGEDAKEVWQTFRNTPSHMAIFKLGTGGGVFDYAGFNFEQAKLAIREKNTNLMKLAEASQVDPISFYKQNRCWLCNGDMLVEDLRIIEKWLCEKILNSSREKSEKVYTIISRLIRE